MAELVEIMKIYKAASSIHREKGIPQVLFYRLPEIVRGLSPYAPRVAGITGNVPLPVEGNQRATNLSLPIP